MVTKDLLINEGIVGAIVDRNLSPCNQLITVNRSMEVGVMKKVQEQFDSKRRTLFAFNDFRLLLPSFLFALMVLLSLNSSLVWVWA